ncbi:GNAT family N-acetyltransferase [Marinobacterium maritimum]
MDVSLAKANIDNLTGLWRLMGSQRQSSGLHYSLSWPGRCWLEWDLREEYDALTIQACIPSGYLCPIWHAGETSAQLEQQLVASGFEMGLQQLVMVLPLGGQEPGNKSDRLDLSLLEHAGDAEAWADLCGRAFGYSIDASVIERLRQQPDVEVLWAKCGGVPVATAILYRTGAVVGVHQVGVPQEQQGKGIARELMQQLVARAQATGAEYLCLQASAAGEPLYLSMGFQPQFTLRSYRRA